MEKGAEPRGQASNSVTVARHDIVLAAGCLVECLDVEAARVIPRAELNEILWRLEFGTKRSRILFAPFGCVVGTAKLVPVSCNPLGNEISGLCLVFIHGVRERRLTNPS